MAPQCESVKIACRFWRLAWAYPWCVGLRPSARGPNDRHPAIGARRKAGAHLIARHDLFRL